MIISNNSTFKLAWLLFVAVLGFTTACSSDEPRTPTAPGPVIGAVTGLVRGEAPVTGRIPRPHPVVANATVTVVGGVASGSRTSTREDGTFELSAAGTFKLRFEHPSFITRESNEIELTPGGVTVPDVVLVTAPWTITGRIFDSLGNPVPDAEVAAGYFNTGFFLADYGRVRTDAAGRYVISSSRPRFESISVAASKAGFHPMGQLLSAKCCGAVPDISIVRIVSITPTAPTSLRVGESVEMPACVIVFDTGETRNVFVRPESSVPSVVSVAPSTHWYAMTGNRTGVATLTFDLWGAIATLQVQVE